MNRLSTEVLNMLSMDDETAQLIMEYLNTLVEEGNLEPLLPGGTEVTIADVERSLDSLLNDGYVVVTFVDKDRSLPECHGKWYGLTEKGRTAVS